MFVQWEKPHNQSHFCCRLGVLGSAVCSYSVKSLQELFDNSPYLKETGTKGFDGTSLWVEEVPVNLSVGPGRPKVCKII